MPVPLLALATMLGTAEPLAQPPAVCSQVLGHMTNSDGARTTMVVSDREHCLEVRLTGRVTFDDADADVKTMDPGSTLVATESRGGGTRALTLVERSGAIDRAYRVNGEVRPVAESTAWFRGVVLDLVREAGYGAPERVARIRRQGGVGAVLDEVRRIHSDHVRQIYLETVLASSGLTVDEVRRVTRAASDDLSSDHAKGMVLRAAVDLRGDDREVADAAVRGAGTIGSDHERAELLRRVLERVCSDDAVVARALDAAAEMGSDHERANVLATALDRAEPTAPTVRASFFRTVDGVGSDHERRRVLESLAGRDSLGTATAHALLASAARIGSDHEKAAVLLALAWHPDRLRDPGVRAAFDAALKSIGSDAEYRRVAGALAR
ncbi:hypothetical protein [Gemmatirosa kalamazoonensis]|nr:hypothetical protein [Gemmatirosa kalamazoonensis]